MIKNNHSLVTFLGHNIRAERFRNGLSQGQLSEKTGLHRTYIGVVERGEKNITVFNCSKIANALNISITDLLRKTEESIRVSEISDGLSDSNISL